MAAVVRGRVGATEDIVALWLILKPCHQNKILLSDTWSLGGTNPHYYGTQLFYKKTTKKPTCIAKWNKKLGPANIQEPNWEKLFAQYTASTAGFLDPRETSTFTSKIECTGR